jgi:spore maturation protein CgeB
VEGLFPPGSHLRAKSFDEMTAAIALVLKDKDCAAELVRTGLDAIRTRHSCAHRITELLAIIAQVGGHAPQQREPRAPAASPELTPRRIAAI